MTRPGACAPEDGVNNTPKMDWDAWFVMWRAECLAIIARLDDIFRKANV